MWVEHDGLDWYYTYTNADGKDQYLLSNNIPIADRTKFENLFFTHWRNSRISMGLGAFAAFETVLRVNYFKKMAIGWRTLSGLGFSWLYYQLLMAYSSVNHSPAIGAFLRKHEKLAVTDMFDITDEKREYFYIDTSQAMNYTHEDLEDMHSANNGPQPDDVVLNASWYAEVDKFLRGEPNNLRGHEKYLDYDFKFVDKSFPTAEAVTSVMHRTD